MVAQPLRRMYRSSNAADGFPQTCLSNAGPVSLLPPPLSRVGRCLNLTGERVSADWQSRSRGNFVPGQLVVGGLALEAVVGPKLDPRPAAVCEPAVAGPRHRLPQGAHMRG